MKRRLPLRPRQRGRTEVLVPLVTILVRTRYGTWAPIRFTVDTGADVTAIPIPLAQDEAIPFNRSESVRGVASGLVGSVERYRGHLQVRLFGEDFLWPCDFLDAPPSQGAPSATTRRHAVLGRAGFLAAFHLCMDEDFLTLQRRLNHKPWWFRLARPLLPPWVVSHAVDAPL
jgi:hypothetical protein